LRDKIIEYILVPALAQCMGHFHRCAQKVDCCRSMQVEEKVEKYNMQLCRFEKIEDKKREPWEWLLDYHILYGMWELLLHCTFTLNLLCKASKLSEDLRVGLAKSRQKSYAVLDCWQVLELKYHAIRTCNRYLHAAG